MKYFSAKYEQSSKSYSSFIYAASLDDARRIVKLRNIGEEILGELASKSKHFQPQPLPSDFYRERQLLPCMHTLMFYGWIAGKAGVIDPLDDILSDRGMLHEVMHEMHHPDVYGYRDPIMAQLLCLEARIPGLISYDPTVVVLRAVS